MNIRDVILHRRLEVLFHPIVDLSLGRIIGFEALGRAYDNEGKFIPPNKLFESAKQQNLTFPLDLALQEKALQRFSETGVSGECLLFLNLERESLENGEITVKWLLNKINHYGIKPKGVVLEILESEMDDRHILKFVEITRRAGFNIALDDFGVKHSNLDRLVKLNPNIVKVDREILKYVKVDGKRKIIVTALHETLNRLGIFTLAEGVDNEEDALLLFSIGISIYQGFYFYKPMRYNEINLSLIYDTRIENIYKKLKHRQNIAKKLRGSMKKDILYVIETITNVSLQNTSPSHFDSVLESYVKTYKEILGMYVVDSEGKLTTQLHYREELKEKVHENPIGSSAFVYRRKDVTEDCDGMDLCITEVYLDGYLGVPVKRIVKKFNYLNNVYFLITYVPPDF